jgi:hypothetical protein
MMHSGTSLRRDMVQNLHERAKAQVRDFAPPQGFHALQIESFQHDDVILCAELMGHVPMERVTEMANPPVHTGQMQMSFPTIVGASMLARQIPVGLGHRP